MAAPLATELGLGAGDLGLLTSVYFLTFAAAQIPIGILLDRYGPRRVQSTLLVVAALGSALFAVSDNFSDASHRSGADRSRRRRRLDRGIEGAGCSGFPGIACRSSTV